MAERHIFSTDAAIIARLGQQLVAKQETALIELVKNAYDADATSVAVAFEGRGGSGAAIEVRDNGLGMSRLDLINGFLRLASEMKVQRPTSPRYGRTRAGRKGIGRFSAQRLGDRLTLTTYSADEPATLQLVADWTEFAPGRRLEDVGVTLQELAPVEPGTVVRIEGLHDDWTNAQIRACWRGVLALQQPFPVAPVLENEGDPGFSVRFLDGGGLFSDDAVIADMQTEILDHLPAVIEMRVDAAGDAAWRISKNAFGEARGWRPIHHEHRDTPTPPAYTALRNVMMKTYHVVLDPTLLPSVVFTRVRDVLRREGGVRLYRNGFRVVPYGEPEDDWLGLDEIYSRRDYLANLANRNFFGIIEVKDPAGVLFDEHTSREGLIETVAFAELRGLASSVLITAATQIHSDRGRKTRTNAASPRMENSAQLAEVRAAIHATREAAERAALKSGETQEVIALAVDAERVVDIAVARIASERTQLADEAAMLRLLSSIGMTTAEFSHETGMSFEAFRLDLDRVFEVAVAAAGSDRTFNAQAARARQALVRLETLTAYLNTTVASRALREIHAVSLSKAVEDFARGVTPHAATQSTTMEIRVPPFDPVYTRPMHEAELASVLLNCYTNAIKAMKRTIKDRRILIVVDRDDDHDEVRLQFCDTGDGVPEEIRGKIFEPFFTTRAAPAARASDTEHAQGTGLGLWIVDQIARSAQGTVRVGDAPPGYSTCFELRLPSEDGDGEGR